MMENKAEELQETTNPVNKKAKSVEKLKVKKQEKKGRAASWIVVLILLWIHIAVYWLWQQQVIVNNQFGDKLSELAVAAKGVPSVLDDYFNRSLTPVNKQLVEIENDQNSITEAVKSLKEEHSFSNADIEYHWAIAEITHLLNLANQRVLIAKDVTSAIAAIELADERIEGMMDYRLYPLRALLAEERLALMAVNNADIAGLTLKLQSALHNVNTLQVLFAAHINTKESQQEVEQNNALSALWQQVKSLVVIRHQENGATAVMVPEQRYFLYQNLHLKLESAHLALLMRDQASFDANVLRAQEWLNEYFIGDERDAMLSLLSELSNNKIESVLPDISASLRWLQEFDQ